MEKITYAINWDTLTVKDVFGTPNVTVEALWVTALWEALPPEGA